MKSVRTAKFAEVLLVLTLSCVAAVAGEPSVRSASCGGVHRPGDRITCYVRFAKTTNFKDLQVDFNLPREDRPRKRGIYKNFVLRETKKLGPRVYSVSGVINDCVPGTYNLAAVV